MEKIKINVLDNSYEYDKGISLSDIAKDFKDEYEYSILAGFVDNLIIVLIGIVLLSLLLRMILLVILFIKRDFFLCFCMLLSLYMAHVVL